MKIKKNKFHLKNHLSGYISYDDIIPVLFIYIMA